MKHKKIKRKLRLKKESIVCLTRNEMKIGGGGVSTNPGCRSYFTCSFLNCTDGCDPGPRG